MIFYIIFIIFFLLPILIFVNKKIINKTQKDKLKIIFRAINTAFLILFFSLFLLMLLLFVPTLVFQHEFEHTESLKRSDCGSIGGGLILGVCCNITNRNPLKCESLKTIDVKFDCYKAIAEAENNAE